MLKHIAPDQVRLGMYIVSFEGRWLAHPFWRRRFHVTCPEDLRRVRESKVTAVVIDAAKTLAAPSSTDIAAMPLCVATDRVPDRVAGSPARTPPPPRRTGARPPRDGVHGHPPPDPDAPPSAAAERAAVVRVLADSAKAVRHAFDAVSGGRPIQSGGFVRAIDDISDVMTHSRSMLIGLSRLKRKDEYTFFHSVSVGALLLGFARELGFDDDVARDLALGGLLHDVGKMKVSDAILNKPGPLTEAEFAEMKRHPELGHEVLVQDPTISPAVLEVTLRHHERIDGRGYPGGLAGDQVSLYARMAGICDVFDALTSARAYKDALPMHDAVTMMAGWEGHFDRALLIAFMRSIGLYPAGMLVRLSSQRLGIVLPQTRHAGRPRVRVLHCAVANRPLPPCDVVISESETGERVVAEERPEDWAIDDWTTLRDRILATTIARAA